MGKPHEAGNQLLRLGVKNFPGGDSTGGWPCVVQHSEDQDKGSLARGKLAENRTRKKWKTRRCLIL